MVDEPWQDAFTYLGAILLLSLLAMAAWRMSRHVVRRVTIER